MTTRTRLAGQVSREPRAPRPTNYPGTRLSAQQTEAQATPPPSAEHFATWKADISYVFDKPMKQRVYPAGMVIPALHSFFVSTRGTWYRRLGSYPIQVIEPGTARVLFQETDLVVTSHEPRYIYGARLDPGRIAT